MEMSEPVPLMTAPNAPSAELLCARLRNAGIPAFYECASGWTPVGSAAQPAQVFVRPDDLERARRLVAER